MDLIFLWTLGRDICIVQTKFNLNNQSVSHKQFSLATSQRPEDTLVISQALELDLVSWSKPILKCVHWVSGQFSNSN